METKNGVIKKIEKSDGISKVSGKPYLKYTYTIGDMLYSTFDIGIGESFKVGDSVVMEGEQNGKYWNMKTMKLSNGVVDLSAPVHTTPRKDFEAHLSIEQVRTNALNCALLICKNDDRVVLMEVADSLVKWIQTGQKEAK